MEVHARGRLRVHRQHHVAELASSAAGRRPYRLMDARACARSPSITAGLMLREAASLYPVNTYDIKPHALERLAEASPADAELGPPPEPALHDAPAVIVATAVFRRIGHLSRAALVARRGWGAGSCAASVRWSPPAASGARNPRRAPTIRGFTSKESARATMAPSTDPATRWQPALTPSGTPMSADWTIASALRSNAGLGKVCITRLIGAQLA